MTNNLIIVIIILFLIVLLYLFYYYFNIIKDKVLHLVNEVDDELHPSKIEGKKTIYDIVKYELSPSDDIENPTILDTYNNVKNISKNVNILLDTHMKDLMPAMASASGGASTGGARHRARSHSRKGHKASLMF